MRSTTKFGTVKDDRAGDLEPYLMLLFHKVVIKCIVKLSKRASSSEVYIYISYSIIIILYHASMQCRYLFISMQVLQLWNETNF